MESKRKECVDDKDGQQSSMPWERQACRELGRVHWTE